MGAHSSKRPPSVASRQKPNPWDDEDDSSEGSAVSLTNGPGPAYLHSNAKAETSGSRRSMDMPTETIMSSLSGVSDASWFPGSERAAPCVPSGCTTPSTTRRGSVDHRPAPSSSAGGGSSRPPSSSIDRGHAGRLPSSLDTHSLAGGGGSSVGGTSGTDRRGASAERPASMDRPTGGGGGLQRVASHASQQYSEASGSVASDRPASSTRSSFARERISLDLFHGPASPSSVHSSSTTPLLPVPAELRPLRAALAIVPPATPVPLRMLQLLWGQDTLAASRRLALELAQLEVLRIAELEDGSTWCLVAADHQRLVQEAPGAAAEAILCHCVLLDRYTKKGALPAHKVLDDGYFMQQAAYHMAGAGRLAALRALLSEPEWIEAKLHAYGIGAIVADFRRYLQWADDEEGSDVRLLLQAFQLSLSACMEHPTCRMLREQMVARVMTVAKAGTLQEWYGEQTSRMAGDAMLSAGHSSVHLMPRTSSLQQAGGLHRMTLRGHTAALRGVCISPNGQDVITIGDDGTAQVFDMNVGDCVMQLSRSHPLSAVAVSPDGRLCVVAGADGHCAVWELAQGAVLHVLRGHTAKVNSVAIELSGLRCITASEDGSLRVWSLGDGRCEHVLRGHGGAHSGALGGVHEVALSFDGALAASASVDTTVRVWDLDEGVVPRCRHVLEGHTGGVTSVVFIGATACLLTASHDSTARVWDALGGRCIHVLAGHTGPLNKVSVDASGGVAVTASDDMTARVWDLATGACRHVLVGHAAWVSDAAITRDGLKVVTVSGDHNGAIWDVTTGACDNVLEGHSGAVGSVVLTFRGRFAVTASEDCTARVWDLQAGSTNLPPAHEGKIKSVQTLAGGTHVVSVAEDGQALVWDAVQGTVVRTIEGNGAAVSFLAAQSSGATFVTGSSNRQLCQWDVSDGQLRHSLPPQQGSRVKSMAVDGAGMRAVVVLYDSTLSVWDLVSGMCLQQLIRRADRDPARVHSGAINAALLTADGRTAVTCSKDCTSRVWDVAGGTCRLVLTGHKDAVVAMSLSPDETLLATGSLDHTVHISSMADGGTVAALDHPGPVTHLTFSPNGRFLAALVDARSIVIWDLQSRSCSALLKGHRADVNGLLFSPDSRLLVSWSHDCTVQIWRSVSGQPAAFFMADAAIASVCFAGTCPADILAVGDVRGVMHFLDFPTEVQQPSW